MLTPPPDKRAFEGAEVGGVGDGSTSVGREHQKPIKEGRDRPALWAGCEFKTGRDELTVLVVSADDRGGDDCPCHAGWRLRMWRSWSSLAL